MCGIAGYYSINLAGDPRLSIKRMTECLSHRGPDDDGYYVGPHMALGHRRLSIIDLKTGHQPIFNEDRTKSIVFNGEIFNHLEIRDELMRCGHQFSTRSDTEVILHAYEEWGEGCVERLRGMFAFAIWDEPNETLFLARDRFGIKPLFYAHYDGKFVFSSEMKSILTDPDLRRMIDPEALASYFLFSYVPAPLTIFQTIRKLLPGHLLIFRKNQATIKKYWDIHFEPDHRKKESDFIAEGLDLLRESVRIRLMSEVPLGAFLSGGIDSSTVVALMSGEMSSPVNTFTIGFGGNIGGFEDERPYARMVAERYRTCHREHEVMPDLDGLIEKIVDCFDEPFADDSTIPSYFVYKMAREHVTVALSGLGGDEAFGGYERYLGFQISRAYSRLPQFLRKGVIQPIVERLPESSSGGSGVHHMKRFIRSSSTDPAERYLGFVTKLADRYRESFFSNAAVYREAFDATRKRFLEHFASDNAHDPLNKVFYCDLKTYLPDDILACTDRMSMHHSLEVRVPFLDHKLMEFCATIPPGMKIRWLQKKYLLKKAVVPLLPEPVIRHKKQGFVGPMARWLQTDLRETTLRRLSEANLKRHGLLNSATVDRVLKEHYEGLEQNDTLIWSLLIFQTWFDRYMY